MIIGGLANAVWGVPRATLDVDVTVWADEERWPQLLAGLAREFVPMAADPLAFARRTRVFSLQSGQGVQMATADDLIVMKLVPRRPRDAEDVRGILWRRRGELDLG